MRKTLSFAICYMLLSYFAQAQLLDLQQLQLNGTLPPALLNSRTVVLIQARDQPVGDNAGGKPVINQKEPWKAVAEKVHPLLKNVGIDAVAYYDWRNVNAGPDATKAFAEAFRQRAIDNLLVVQARNGNYVVTVSPIGKEGLVNKGGAAWQKSGAELAAIIGSLQNAASKADLKLSNYLIIDKPEYFYTTDIKLNKRFFTYALDLKLDKLAVPAYDIFQEENIGDSLAELQSIMQAYPYQWGITKPGLDEKDLRLKEGYQYVLLYLHTNAANIRKFLNYGANKEIPLELQADLSDDQSVYKFYIRHIYTGDVYGGTHWDAASTWEEALRNHLSYLRKEQASNIK